MTDERLFELLAAHDGPADVDPGFEDRLYVLLQREMGRSRRSGRPALLLVAALMAILMISAAVMVGSGVVELPWLDESPTPSTAASPVPTTTDSQPPTVWVNRMPGTTASRGGVYGTTVLPSLYSLGAGMHRVVEDGTGLRQTQITFAAKDDCFVGGTGPEPVQVTVAGLDGLYVEPYDDPSVQFGLPRDLTTGAHALPIGDRTLCVYLSWGPATTPGELEAARQVVESIRGRPVDAGGIQIIFTLPGGWDTG